MKNSTLAAAALVGAVFCAAPVRARAANAFMGHYGYMLAYDENYSANPAFHGAIEVADIFPKTCRGLKTRMDCAKIGMIDLAVLPKKLIVAETGAKTFDAYLASMLSDAKEAGIKTIVKRGTRAGFPAVTIVMPNHPQALNALILISGSKVYYRFKYNDKTGAKEASAMANSLKEIAPHDNPPEPGTR